MRFEALDEAGRRRVHEAAIAILEGTGLQIDPASPVAARLRDLDFRIAGDGRLLLPRARLEAAIAQAPRVIRLGGRDASRLLTLDGSRTFVTTDGCGSRTIDLETGRVRASILADVAASARLTDALEAYHVYWNMVSAQDVPIASRVAREFLEATRNTTKHVQMIDVGRPEEARALVRMAEVLGETGASSGPPVSILISVVSPLRLDPLGMESALAFAAAGLPVVCTSMPIASVTAPATAAGSLLIAHAEAIGFAAVLQLLVPGCPVLYCAFPAFADARSGMTSYRDPRRSWACAAAVQMGRMTNLPVFVSAEIVSLMMEPDVVCSGGMLETSTLLSFEQLVLDDETHRDWRMAAAAPPIDEDSLAVDLIRQVGPGGHFLAQKHTGRRIREFMVHRYIEPARAAEADDAGAGCAPARESARDLARRQARRLVGTHRAPPIPDRAATLLERIVEDPDRT
jgi:trimethylamine--corrinoid protein Co-methyltransferase